MWGYSNILSMHVNTANDVPFSGMNYQVSPVAFITAALREDFHYLSLSRYQSTEVSLQQYYNSWASIKIITESPTK